MDIKSAFHLGDITKDGPIIFSILTNLSQPAMISANWLQLFFLEGILPFANVGCYAVSKHAIEAFTYCLMEEVVHDGISVHLIRPTGQKTNIINPEILRKQWVDDFNRQTQEVKEKYGPNLTKCKSVLISWK